jgi:hypothetical protein
VGQDLDGGRGKFAGMSRVGARHDQGWDGDGPQVVDTAERAVTTDGAGGHNARGIGAGNGLAYEVPDDGGQGRQ